MACSLFPLFVSFDSNCSLDHPCSLYAVASCELLHVQAELEDEFVFPVTVEDGSVVDLVLKATDNVEAKVRVALRTRNGGMNE